MTTRREMIGGLGLAAVAAALATSAEAQAAHPSNRPIPHEELGRFWATLKASTSWSDFKRRVPNYGGFPWRFVGKVDLHGDGLMNVQVNILEVVPDARGAVIGVPGVLVDYEVVEPPHMSGRKTFRQPFQFEI